MFRESFNTWVFQLVQHEIRKNTENHHGKWLGYPRILRSMVFKFYWADKEDWEPLSVTFEPPPTALYLPSTGSKPLIFAFSTRRKWGIWTIGAKHIFASSSAHRHDHLIRLYIFETASSMRIFWCYFERDSPSVCREIGQKRYFSLWCHNYFFIWQTCLVR